MPVWKIDSDVREKTSLARWERAGGEADPPATLTATWENMAKEMAKRWRRLLQQVDALVETLDGLIIGQHGSEHP